MKDYIPVNCAFHDYLEHFATIRETVSVKYFQENKEQRAEGVIIDLSGGRNGEFIHLSAVGGVEKIIRMDYILSINDITQTDFGTDCFI